MRQDESTSAFIEVAAAPVEPSRQRRLEAFSPAARPAVARIAALGSRFEDLADSFPGLLFALATGYGHEGERAAALAKVEQGASLKEAAAALGLPFWLKRLPASAFSQPLAAVPAEPQLVARLVSLVPQTPAAAAAWLERVLVSHAAGRPELTLWVAQQYRSALPSPRSASFLGVLAWSWFALAGREHRAGRLLTETWKPGLGARRASLEARLWQERIALDVCLGRGLDDTWVAEGVVGDLTFTALRTSDDFLAEAQAMDNCLDRYADKLEGRIARVFSIRRKGRSIADVEIAAHEREPGHPVIAQLRGPHNRRAPLDVWQAAYAWLGGQPLRLADNSLKIRVSRPARERRQMELWSPFLERLPPHARDAFLVAVLGRRKRAAPRGSAASRNRGSS